VKNNVLSQRAAPGISRPDDPNEQEVEMAQESGTSKHIACANIMPGCPFEASAPTEAELMAKVAAHAATAHGVTDVTPELAAKVKAAIKTS
jgi:predicted small metal-binding protein